MLCLTNVLLNNISGVLGMESANPGDYVLQPLHHMDASATRLGSRLHNPQVAGAIQLHLWPVGPHGLNGHLAAQVDGLSSQLTILKVIRICLSLLLNFRMFVSE